MGKEWSKQCPVGTCTWGTTPKGARFCTTCSLVPCADPMVHRDSSIAHPVELASYPPAYDVICEACGERYVWCPAQQRQSIDDTHVVRHAHDETARKFGHKVRDIAAEDAAKLAAILTQAANSSLATRKG